jgi:hypothetical protein
MTALTPLLTAITVQWLEAYEEQFKPTYLFEDTRTAEARLDHQGWDLTEEEYKAENPNWEAEKAEWDTKEVLRKESEAAEDEKLYGDLPF